MAVLITVSGQGARSMDRLRDLEPAGGIVDHLTVILRWLGGAPLFGTPGHELPSVFHANLALPRNDTL